MDLDFHGHAFRNHVFRELDGDEAMSDWPMKLDKQDHITLLYCLDRLYRYAEDIIANGDYSNCLLEDMMSATQLKRKLRLCVSEMNKVRDDLTNPPENWKP